MGMWSVSMLPLAHSNYEAGFTLALFMLAHTNSGFECRWFVLVWTQQLHLVVNQNGPTKTFLKRWSRYNYQWTLMHLTLTRLRYRLYIIFILYHVIHIHVHLLLLFHWITAAQHMWSGIIMMCAYGIYYMVCWEGLLRGMSNDAEYFSPLAVLAGTQESWKHDALYLHFQWESWKHDGLPVVRHMDRNVNKRVCESTLY